MEGQRTIVLLPPIGSSDYAYIAEVVAKKIGGHDEILLVPLGFHSDEELGSFEATIKYPEVFFNRSRSDQIDSQALSLALSWYRPLGDHIVYDGVNLAQMCEGSFFLIFVDCLRSIDIATRLIKTERPDRLILPRTRLTKELGEICYESLPNAIEYIAGHQSIKVERSKEQTTANRDQAGNLQPAHLWNMAYMYQRLVEITGPSIIRKAVFFNNVYARQKLAAETKKLGLRPLRSIPYRKPNKKTRAFSDDLQFRNPELLKKIVGDQQESEDALFIAKSIAQERFTEFLSHTAPILSEYVEWARYFSKKMKPKVFVSMEDFTPVNRCLSRVLREGGAQVLILQHGLLAKDMAGFYLMPIEGQIQAVWGRYYQEWHSNKGKNPDALIVTGCPNFENIRPPNEKLISARQKLGLSADRPLMLIGSSRFGGISSIYTLEKEQRFFEGVFRGLNGERAFQIVLKLHPSCGKSYYDMAEQAAQKNGVKMILTKDYLRELLAIAQVVVMPVSTIGYEALMLSKPLVCVDFEGLGDENYFVNARVAIGVQRPIDLVQGIRAAIDLTGTKEYELSRALFIDYHLNGEDPSRRVAELVRARYEGR
jgi:CDP-glycerol glycerophosphotransferase (TagB/SpsB family)